MPRGSSIGNLAENIQHFAAVRFRVTGVGSLQCRFLSLDEEIEQVLAPLVMQSSTGREPRILSNFISQRGQLEIKTTEINEKFRINRIIIFLKEQWSEYPS